MRILFIRQLSEKDTRPQMQAHKITVAVQQQASKIVTVLYPNTCENFAYSVNYNT